MINYEQRLLLVLEGIERELKGIREELANYHGDKTEEKENATD